MTMREYSGLLSNPGRTITVYTGVTLNYSENPLFHTMDLRVTVDVIKSFPAHTYVITSREYCDVCKEIAECTRLYICDHIASKIAKEIANGYTR